MRTTLDLPDDLVSKAMEITGAKTKTQLVRDALNELIMRRKRMRLMKYKGQFDLDIDLDTLRER